MPRILLIGLGPGDPALLTRAAAECLAQASVIYTSATDHPALANLPRAALRLLPTNELAAATMLTEHAVASEMVCCGLTGTPDDHDLTMRLRADQRWRSALRIIPGVSLVDACCTALGIAARGAGLQILGAPALLPQALEGAGNGDEEPAAAPWCKMQGIGAYTPPLTPYPLVPTQPALILATLGNWQLAMSQTNLQALITNLQLRYPPTHMLQLVQLDRDWQEARVWEAILADLAYERELARINAIYLPPLAVAADRRGLDGLAWVVARLLGPGGCPWDRRQTHQSLRPGLLEETHEVLETLDSNDMAGLSEELGDLLLQVIVHSEMARQAGHFDLGDVLAQISSKLIRRHPHVFGSLAAEDTGQVLHNWEQIKAQELAKKGRSRASTLDGIPAALPALATAQKLVKKAGRVGFEWRAIEDVWAKLREELDELAEAATHGNPEHIAEEFGDVLFVAANLGRWLNLDAETALREANTKFRRRFDYVEQTAQAQGHNLSTLSLDDMIVLWQRAKHETQPVQRDA